MPSHSYNRITPSGTRRVMLLRFSDTVDPLRLAHPSSSYIQRGVPAGTSIDGMSALSVSTKASPYGTSGVIGTFFADTAGWRRSKVPLHWRSIFFVLAAFSAFVPPADSGKVGWVRCSIVTPLGEVDRRECCPRGPREPSECHHRLHGARFQRSSDPLIAIVAEGGLADVLAAGAQHIL
jgi:hypothetical protein